MKNLFLLIIVLIFFNNSFSQTFTSLNFEGAGYVSEILSPTHVVEQFYARTDIGGVYRLNNNNPNTWEFISQQFTTPAVLMVQGFATPKDSGPEGLLIAVGNYDIPGDPSNGVWKTTNCMTFSPVNWTKTLNI